MATLWGGRRKLTSSEASRGIDCQPTEMWMPFFGGGGLAAPTVICGLPGVPPFFARGGPIRQKCTRPSVFGTCSTKH